MPARTWMDTSLTACTSPSFVLNVLVTCSSLIKTKPPSEKFHKKSLHHFRTKAETSCYHLNSQSCHQKLPHQVHAYSNAVTGVPGMSVNRSCGSKTMFTDFAAFLSTSQKLSLPARRATLLFSANLWFYSTMKQKKDNWQPGFWKESESFPENFIHFFRHFPQFASHTFPYFSRTMETVYPGWPKSIPLSDLFIVQPASSERKSSFRQFFRQMSAPSKRHKKRRTPARKFFSSRFLSSKRQQVMTRSTLVRL